MSGQQFSNLLFVINPISGDIEKSEITSEIEEFCTRQQLNASFFETSGENDLVKLKDALKFNNYDAVFAVGGDGTVHLVGTAMLHSKTPMGIIPMGSGNGLSKDLSIPQEVREALEVVRNYHIRPIDTLSVNTHLSVHLSDLGFNALVVKLFNEGHKRGPGAYAFLAMQQYLTYEPKNFRIETDSENFSGPAFMITVTNANAYGSNAAINPTGIIDDGKFELCIIEPFPLTAGLELLYHLYNNTIGSSIYSKIIRCQRATIYNLENDVTHIDGEPIDLGEKIDIKIQAKSLKMLTPVITLEGKDHGSQTLD